MTDGPRIIGEDETFVVCGPTMMKARGQDGVIAGLSLRDMADALPFENCASVKMRGTVVGRGEDMIYYPTHVDVIGSSDGF